MPPTPSAAFSRCFLLLRFRVLIRALRRERGGGRQRQCTRWRAWRTRRCLTTCKKRGGASGEGAIARKSSRARGPAMRRARTNPTTAWTRRHSARIVFADTNAGRPRFRSKKRRETEAVAQATRPKRQKGTGATAAKVSRRSLGHPPSQAVQAWLGGQPRHKQPPAGEVLRHGCIA